MQGYKTKIPEFQLKKISTDILKEKIIDSQSSARYARQFYFDDLTIYESCFIILMNRNNNTIGYVKISQGGIAGTIVDVKLIAKYALESLASTVIVVHNHPTGNLNPSEADKRLTKSLKDVLKICEVDLLDHIILTEDNYFSFADNGIL